MTKVTHTETHDNALVCKGRLIKINQNRNDLGLNFTPIIISENESVGIGDLGYKNGFELRHFTKEVMETTSAEEMKSHYKIISLNEDFSPEILRDMVEGMLKDQDEILIECEFVNMPSQGHGTVNSSFHRIKLNKDNHITIWPGKSEVSWTYNFNEYCKYAKEGDIKMDSAVNYGVWLEQNFNSPTRKACL